MGCTLLRTKTARSAHQTESRVSPERFRSRASSCSKLSKIYVSAERAVVWLRGVPGKSQERWGPRCFLDRSCCLGYRPHDGLEKAGGRIHPSPLASQTGLAEATPKQHTRQPLRGSAAPA